MQVKVLTWIQGARPKTLLIGLASIMTGIALVLQAGFWPKWDLLIWTASSGLLFQIGANLANDYYDYLQGADTATRVGFTRLAANGQVSLRLLRRAIFLTLAAAVSCTIPLLWKEGIPILLLALFFTAAALFYTKGKHSLAYIGLAEVAVFFFFGPLAILTTYYLQTHALPLHAFLLSLPTGLLAAAVVLVNNLRDVDTDRHAQKKTLCVRLGPRFGQWLYTLLLITSIGIATLGGALTPLLGLATACLTVPLIKTVWSYVDPAELNTLLANTARFLFFFSCLYFL